MKDNIPDWLNNEETYSPKQDKDSFINKSALSILRSLSKIKTIDYNKENNFQDYSIKFTFLFALILLISASKNFSFVFIIITIIFIRLCLFDGQTILKILKAVSASLLFSVFIILPSIFFNNNIHNCVFILCKIGCSMTLISIFSANTQWNALFSSLKTFKVPNILIFILDITLKYIVLLGNLSFNMLTALKLRSVGINKKKQKALSGILGMTFIKSKEMADDMYNAMVCRGFTGEYYIPSKKVSKKILLFYGVLSLLLLVLFLYTEVLIK